LAIAFVPLSLAAVLIAYVPQFFFFLQARTESIDSQQRFIAHQAADTVAGFVQEKFSELEAVAKIGELASVTPEEQRDVLGNLLGLDRAFRQLALLDSQDLELVKVSRISRAAAEQLMDHVEPDLFAQVKQGNRYVSPVYVDSITSEPMVIMAVPATDAFGDFQGTLLAEVNLKFMWDLVDRLEVGETGLAYVVDRQGNLIASGDISRVLRGENVGHLDMVGEFMRNPMPADEAVTGMVQGIDGTIVFGTYVPLGVPDWAVVTELPMAEAIQPSVQSTAISILAVLVVATLVGLMGIYIARRLAGPLLNLTETATRITGGETGLQAAIEGPTEVASLATAFNSMTAQLRELIGSLEQRVAERTHELVRRATQLEAASQVARDAATILDPDELLPRTVELIRERLGFYHASIFLLDDRKEHAVLRAATGEVGRQLIAQDFKLKVGEVGMVGHAAASGRPRIARDVQEDRFHFDNPLLPDTRSEVTLPLQIRGQVLGVLDVQSIQVGAFTDEVVAVLQTLADQVAVALDKARLFAESQEALEATRRAYAAMSREAWIERMRAQPDLGYRRDRDGISTAGDVWRPRMEVALRTGETTLGQGDDATTLTIPVKVLGEVIGVIDARKPDDAGAWTAEEVTLLETLTDQLSATLVSAQLFEDTQRRARDEQQLRTITAEVRDAPDLDAILQTTVQEMARALGVERVFVQLGTPPLLEPQAEG
jgi:GAF domain-containing protein/HAMP domain-containing protein